MSNFDVGNPYGLREFQLTGNTLTCREYVAIRHNRSNPIFGCSTKLHSELIPDELKISKN